MTASIDTVLPVPTSWVTQGGAVGLLAMAVVMIMVGLLVPRRTYLALERDRDYWREVALKAMGQADALLPGAELATEVTRALADVARKQRDDQS